MHIIDCAVQIKFCTVIDRCPHVIFSSGSGNSGSRSATSSTKSLGIRGGDRPKTCNLVAVKSDGHSVEGKVNGFESQFVVDTGAEITIVPGNLVYESQLLPDTVEILGATGVPVETRMAEVEIDVLGKKFLKKVAVASAGMLCQKVLFSVPMEKKCAERLLAEACGSESPLNKNEIGEQSEGCELWAANAVTRSMSERELAEKASEEIREQEGSVPVSLEEIDNIAGEQVSVESAVEAAVLDSTEVASECTGVGESVGSAEVVSEWSVVEADGDVECASVDETNEGEVEPVDLSCPVLVDVDNLEKLKRETAEDGTLRHCRELANDGKMGYSYKDGLLFHRVVDEVLGARERLVLPKVRRDAVLRLAHDQMGHVGGKKMRELVNSRFTWPGLGADIDAYCSSCELCLKVNKAGNRKVQMVERPIISEPFESVAVDIVGPLPKGKGGARFVLTLVCLASRWPEAVAMRTCMAAEVAEGLIAMFSRSGFPLKILSDRGSVFIGKVLKRVYEILGIDSIQTSPYRPQGNGIVERFHGTLKPMLTKAVANGVDWVTFLPMALFAIRQVVNRDTGFSPHELVFGRRMRGPLDLLYAGWVCDCYKEVEVSKWVMSLQERLKLLHEVAVASASIATAARMKSFNKSKSLRELNVGDKVLLRIPGLHAALEASWEGPYEVVEKVSRVNYRVCNEGGKKSKIVHINNTKRYKSRGVGVNAVCVASGGGE